MRVDMRPGSTNASSSSSSASDSATTAHGGGSVDDTYPGRTYRFSTASEPPVYEFGFGMVRQTLYMLPVLHLVARHRQYLATTATCIIIAPKRLKLRLSGSARKSQKRFRDTPMFKFWAVLARTQPFLSRSVEKRGDQTRFKCRKMVNYYAIRSIDRVGGCVRARSRLS